MALPMRMFWMLSNSVPRIQADQDIRTLTLLVNAQSTEGATRVREALAEQVGEYIRVSKAIPAERDEKGFAHLKALATGGL